MLIAAPCRLGEGSIVVISRTFFMHTDFLEARQRRTMFALSASIGQGPDPRGAEEIGENEKDDSLGRYWTAAQQ